jgi:transposase-like protein
MTDDNICGAECLDGSKCQHPAGSCPVASHSESDAENQQGRPSKLTEGRQENIAVMLEDGHSIGAAARSNGITVKTFFNWMEKGEQQDDGPYAQFFHRITRARGVGEKRYVDTIAEIAKETEDTATLMTLLKSRYPDAWGDAERGEQTGGVEVVIPEGATIE